MASVSSHILSAMAIVLSTMLTDSMVHLKSTQYDSEYAMEPYRYKVDRATRQEHTLDSSMQDYLWMKPYAKHSYSIRRGRIKDSTALQDLPSYLTKYTTFHRQESYPHRRHRHKRRKKKRKQRMRPNKTYKFNMKYWEDSVVEQPTTAHIPQELKQDNPERDLEKLELLKHKSEAALKMHLGDESLEKETSLLDASSSSKSV